VSLYSGQTTLADIRLQARQRANMELTGAGLNTTPDPYADAFIPTPELNAIINQSFRELYGLITTAYGNGYNVSEWSFVTDGTTEQYDLPLDLFKLMGVEWVQSPGSNIANVSLRQFNFNERNKYSQASTLPPLYGMTAVRYRLNGTKLWLKPLPQSGQTIQLHYAPRLNPLVDQGVMTLTNFPAGSQITITIGDVSLGLVSIGYGNTPAPTEFVVGGTGSIDEGDDGTARSLAAALNLSDWALAGVLTAAASGNTVTIALQQPATVTWESFAPQVTFSPNTLVGPDGDAITWGNVMTGYNGWEEYIITDAAIKMLQKEESDVSILMAQKNMLFQRIQKECENRDENGIQTVTDVYSMNGGGWGGGGWSGGGYLS
jgi:hypothetical protein